MTSIHGLMIVQVTSMARRLPALAWFLMAAQLGACQGTPSSSGARIEVVSDAGSGASTGLPDSKPKGAGQMGAEATDISEIARMDRIVEAAIALPEISKPALEAHLKVSLTHQAEAAPDQLAYEAPLSSGPFQRVFLQLSNPNQNPLVRVAFTVRSGINLVEDALGERFVGPGVKTKYAVDQPDPLIIQYVPHPSGYVVYYIFDYDSEHLISIGFERKGK